MRADEFAEILCDIKDEYIAEAHQYQAKPKANVYMKWAALAACLILAVGGVIIAARRKAPDLPVIDAPDEVVTITEPNEEKPTQSTTTVDDKTEEFTSTSETTEATTSEATTSDSMEASSPVEGPKTTTTPPNEEESVPGAEKVEEEEAPTEETESAHKWPTLPGENDPSLEGLYSAKVNWADENPSSGEPISYDHYMDETIELGTELQLLSYEVVRVYTPEEAYELTQNEAYLGITALYDVHVYYDHIAQQEVDYTVWMSRAGNQLRQWAGCPMLGVGEKYTSIVSYSKDGYRLMPSVEFYLDGEYAYYIGTSNCLLCPVDESNPDMNIPMAEDEWWRITTTKNNPVIFHRKFKEEALVQYIRADWQWRGVAE